MYITALTRCLHQNWGPFCYTRYWKSSSHPPAQLSLQSDLSKQRTLGRATIEKRRYRRSGRRLEAANKTCISQPNLYSIVRLLTASDASQLYVSHHSNEFPLLFEYTAQNGSHPHTVTELFGLLL